MPQADGSPGAVPIGDARSHAWLGTDDAEVASVGAVLPADHGGRSRSAGGAVPVGAIAFTPGFGQTKLVIVGRDIGEDVTEIRRRCGNLCWVPSTDRRIRSFAALLVPSHANCARSCRDCRPCCPRCIGNADGMRFARATADAARCPERHRGRTSAPDADRAFPTGPITESDWSGN